MLASAPACLRDDPPVVYPTKAQLDQSRLPLGPNDKLNLVVYYGSKSITAQYVLDASGEMSVQFIGNVHAGGKTLEEVRKDIQERLGDGYLNNPIVSLSILELNSLTLSVSGMVLKTGNIKFVPGMTITEVIAQSGGFAPLARKNMVKVTRVVNGQKQTYKLPVEKIAEGDRPNFEMMPGDDVFVPERPY
ncbi:MAG TPA: polysaccharide biosynthesis/export family protein [Kofleriaceae bacterium]|nr:polysaccharide biosynthesis/export family protein [Kofleriaceae bacterium]